MNLFVQNMRHIYTDHTVIASWRKNAIFRQLCKNLVEKIAHVKKISFSLPPRNFVPIFEEMRRLHSLIFLCLEKKLLQINFTEEFLKELIFEILKQLLLKITKSDQRLFYVFV